MARLRFFFADEALSRPAEAWSASSWAWGLGPENLGTPHLAKLARTTGESVAEWWKVDLGSPRAVSAFYCAGHDFDGTEPALFLQGNDADAWADPAVELAVTFRGAGVPLVETFEETSLRHWRLAFEKPAAAATREAGRLYLGSWFECLRNPTPGGYEPRGYEDLSDSARTDGGQSHTARAALLRTFRARFEAMPWAQAEAFWRLTETCGLWLPYLLVPTPGNFAVIPPLYGKNRKLPLARELSGAFDGSGWLDGELDVIEEK